MRRSPALVLVATLAAGGAVLGSGAAAASPDAASVPPTTVAPPTVPAVAVSGDALRAAKVAWSRFVAANFATPLAITEPCPLLTGEAAAAHVAAVGLVPSALPYGPSLYRDATGAGIVGIACGVDLAHAADPAGSTGFVVEATLLDGQADFPQYVVRVAGANTPIVPSPALGGATAARCRERPTVCVASWHRDGLVVTVRLDGPRTDASLDQTYRVLLAVVPEVVGNLAGRPAPGS